ncbi:TetR/AcrR family transcriptional regulator [Paenibacillus senegalensis]|uniref:TetR/AcrR family transcriptional regulator n=1 Tax=Paenibacillus senegalensis TaxID=1465766 RepID=UPI000288D5C4|nr:TetR/AcrR family transcriptional regulator [Paenibacillus senegalensis]
MENKRAHTDLRKIRTRKLIRDAFIELLQESDVEKITVHRLAERATINRVTFYLHYRDIPDMVEKMADEMIEDINAVNQKYNSEAQRTGNTRWESLVKLLEHIAEHGEFYKTVLGPNGIPIFRERLHKLFRDRIVSAVDRTGSDSFVEKAGVKKDILIWYDTSAIIGTIISWLQNDMPYTPAFLAKQFALLHNRTGNQQPDL